MSIDISRSFCLNKSPYIGLRTRLRLLNHMSVTTATTAMLRGETTQCVDLGLQLEDSAVAGGGVEHLGSFQCVVDGFLVGVGGGGWCGFVHDENARVVLFVGEVFEISLKVLDRDQGLKASIYAHVCVTPSVYSSTRSTRSTLTTAFVWQVRCGGC
jgi:hypothetical protein